MAFDMKPQWTGNTAVTPLCFLTLLCILPFLLTVDCLGSLSVFLDHLVEQWAHVAEAITQLALKMCPQLVCLLLYFLLQSNIPLPGFSFFPLTLGGKDIG